MSERLAAQILLHDGFEQLDPSHPLGGPDGGRDAICVRNGTPHWVAVYFPRGEARFADVERKFESDLDSARQGGATDFVFVTNQELRLAERQRLLEKWPDHIVLYHLERVTAILDDPGMYGVRRQFLGIEPADSVGAAGGSGFIIGNRGTVLGGRGGSGAVGVPPGSGGSGFIRGDDGLIIGGDGGDAGTPDGRGGRGARSALERSGAPTATWKYGRGGAGANDPEYDRRIELLRAIRTEYAQEFPDDIPYIDAGIDQVPVHWVNKRLEELGEPWRVAAGATGYVMPSLARHVQQTYGHHCSAAGSTMADGAG
jgi:hypothetical protein